MYNFAYFFDIRVLKTVWAVSDEGKDVVLNYAVQKVFTKIFVFLLAQILHSFWLLFALGKIYRDTAANLYSQLKLGTRQFMLLNRYLFNKNLQARVVKYSFSDGLIKANIK